MEGEKIHIILLVVSLWITGGLSLAPSAIKIHTVLTVLCNLEKINITEYVLLIVLSGTYCKCDMLSLLYMCVCFKKKKMS